jgi:iron-sulfur cluster assembly protein
MESTIASTPVKLTQGAIKEIYHLFDQLKDKSNKALRLGVKGGGCAGFSYVLEFDTPTENDNHYVIDGLQIIIDKSQELYLFGTELDFKQGLDNRGFIFINPNASSTCGCGTSFSA